jgi:hypothetical protein
VRPIVVFFRNRATARRRHPRRLLLLASLVLVRCAGHPVHNTGIIVGNNRCVHDSLSRELGDVKRSLRTPFLTIGRLYVTRGTRSLTNLRANTEGLLRIGITHDSLFVAHDSLRRPDISSRTLSILREKRDALVPLQVCDTAFFDVFFSHDVFTHFHARDTARCIFYHFPPAVPRMYHH